MKTITFIVENWYFFFIAFCVLIVAGVKIKQFISASAEERKAIIKEFLLGAVVEAERQFGSKTGSLKSSYVYNSFTDKFPELSTHVSYDQFKELLEDSLIEMRRLIEINESLKNYVNKKEDDTNE